MRCFISNRKVRRFRIQTGLPVEAATVRGNNHHVVLLYLEGGDVYVWDRKTGELSKSTIGWGKSETWLERIRRKRSAQVSRV